jgi:hypothetical protein
LSQLSTTILSSAAVAVNEDSVSLIELPKPEVASSGDASHTEPSPEVFYFDPHGRLVKESDLRGALPKEVEELKGWAKTSEKRPCPNCGRFDRCRISPAGTILACREFDQKTLGCIWGLSNDALYSFYPLNARVAKCINGKPLLESHYNDLRKSGLSDAMIEKAQLATAAEPASITKLLGWKRMPKTIGPVLEIPYPDPLTETFSDYWRLKPACPRLNDDEKPIKYEAPKNKPSRAYFPPGLSQILSDPSTPLLITEGEKKALKAVQEGFACIGIAGVWAWQKRRQAGPNGKKIGPRLLIDDLASFQWGGRTVFIVFDSDAATNQNVRLAERHLARKLTQLGADVRILRLPGGPVGSDGVPAKVGLDDYLVQHCTADLQQLLATAAAPDPSEVDSSGESNEAVDDPHRLARAALIRV